jgi:hypothetical protein
VLTGVNNLASLLQRSYELDIIAKELDEGNLSILRVEAIHFQYLIYLNVKFILEYFVQDMIEIGDIFTHDAVLSLQFSFLAKL